MNNSHEARRIILDLAIFSCQEGTSPSNWELPLRWSFSLAVLNVNLMRVHLRMYPAEMTTTVQSGNETTQKSNAKLWLNVG